MMYDLSKPGHLLAFKRADKRHYLYLYVKDVENPFASLIVLPGIRQVVEILSKENPIELEINQFSEFKRIVVAVDPNVIEDVITVPVEVFVDSTGTFKESLFRMCIENLLNNYRSIFPIREIGPVARDYSFVRFSKNFNEVIDKHISMQKNVIVDAPRKAGKTSFMRQLVKELEKKNYKAYYIDMENVRNPAKFSALFLMSLKNEPFESELDRAQKEIEVAKKIGPNYQEEVECRIKELKGERIILAVDEFSYLIDEMLIEEKLPQKIADFLAWFKRLRQDNRNIQYVFSCSVKFAVFEKIPGNHDLFDDCRECSLLPFDKETAATLVEGIFYSEEIYPPDYVVEEILRLITPYFPFFLQIVTDELIKFYRSSKKFPDKEKIHSIIDKEVIGTSCRRYLDQFIIYLRRYNPKEQIGARAILNHLSRKQEEKLNILEAIYVNATGTPEDFEKTLALLEYDFYLERKKDCYRFNNEIIKNWWKINFAIPGEIE